MLYLPLTYKINRNKEEGFVQALSSSELGTTIETLPAGVNNIKKTFTIEYTKIPKADYDVLMSFLLAQGVTEIFLYVPCNSTIETKVRRVPDSLTVDRLNGGRFTIKFSLIEQYTGLI